MVFIDELLPRLAGARSSICYPENQQFQLLLVPHAEGIMYRRRKQRD
jgi:hypothetical protein